MVSKNCELEIETEIALWKSSTTFDSLVEFSVRRGHIEMRMNELLWSIEATPQLDTAFEFTHIKLKRSKSHLHLSPKLKLLVATLQSYITTVFRVKELLDKLYACSLFLSMAEEDERWWVIVDAEIMAAACKAATEATQQAAKTATIFHVELLMEFPPPEEVMSAASSSGKEIWNDIAQSGVNGGNLLHWCKVHVFVAKTITCFEFEVAVQEFLQGNDEICKIGVVNRRALKVTVRLRNEIWVICYQEGVEPETTYGLNSALPQLIRNYITAALDMSEVENGVNNIVEGLLQRVVGYLTFFPRVCEVCGSHRLMEVTLTCTCSYLCEARRNARALPFTTLHNRLSTLLLTEVLMVMILRGRTEKIHLSSNDSEEEKLQVQNKKAM